MENEAQYDFPFRSEYGISYLNARPRISNFFRLLTYYVVKLL